jgi:hypothetical protein
MQMVKWVEWLSADLSPETAFRLFVAGPIEREEIDVLIKHLELQRRVHAKDALSARQRDTEEK